MALLPMAGLVHEIITITGDFYGSTRIARIVYDTSVWSLIAILGITLLCNWAASIVAICSFRKSYSELRRICRLAEANEAPILRKIFLETSPKVLLVCKGWVYHLASCSRFCSFQQVLFLLILKAGTRCPCPWSCFLFKLLMLLGNAVAVLLLSGSHRMAKVDRSQGSQCGCWKVEKP